jgi:hypothetical protein
MFDFTCGKNDSRVSRVALLYEDAAKYRVAGSAKSAGLFHDTVHLVDSSDTQHTHYKVPQTVSPACLCDGPRANA